MSRRIAVFLMDGGSYQAQLEKECLSASRHHRFEPTFFVADNDADKQVGQIERCLAESASVRPNIIMVSPVRESVLANAAYSAAQRGIGWILFNRWTTSMTDLYRKFPNLPIFSVSADQYEVGRIQGRQFNALLPGGGEVFYLCGPSGTSTVSRRFAGVQEVLAGTNVRLSAVVNGDWTVDGGRREMNVWLRMLGGRGKGPALVVGAQNDNMALGAQRAYAESGLDTKTDPILFTGCDGSTSHGLRWASEGTLSATVVVPPVAGKATTELASQLSGYPRQGPEILLTPSSFPELHVLERLGLESRSSGLYRRDIKGSAEPSASSSERNASDRSSLRSGNRRR